ASESAASESAGPESAGPESAGPESAGPGTQGRPREPEAEDSVLRHLLLHPRDHLREPVLLDDAAELAAVVRDQARALRDDVVHAPLPLDLVQHVVHGDGLLTRVGAVL